MTESGDISLIAPLTALLRRWRLVIFGPLFIGVLAVGLGLINRNYVSESLFMPDTPSGPNAQLLGLAAQFGINLGGPETALSVDFYRTLIRSRELLEAAVQTEYSFVSNDQPPDSMHADLLEIYEVPEGSMKERLFRAQRILGSKVDVSIDRPAGVVTVRVTARWPGLAEQINRRLLDMVNEFNVETLNSSAAARRDFAMRRLKEAEEGLAAAEEAEKRFLEVNRRYQDSPELVFAYRRLQREVDFRQQLLMTLAQSYEQSRVDAIRDVPVITVVGSPEGSARVARRLRRSVTFGIVIGLVFVIGVVVMSEFVEAERRNRPEAYATFRRLWEDTMGRLRLRRSN